MEFGDLSCFIDKSSFGNNSLSDDFPDLCNLQLTLAGTERTSTSDFVSMVMCQGQDCFIFQPRKQSKLSAAEGLPERLFA